MKYKNIILFLIILIALIIPASAETRTCENITHCNQIIANATSGDIIQLTTDIYNHETHGISFKSQSGLTFDGMGHTIDGVGGYSQYGITLRYADNNAIKNVTVSNFGTGVYVFSSNYGIIENITSSYNENAGIALMYSSPTEIRNTLLQENGVNDFDFVPLNKEDNSIELDNVTGSGNYPIGFFNTSTLVTDTTFSSLILCDADKSIFENVTVTGSSILQNNGIKIYYTEYTEFNGILSSENANGIAFYNSNENQLTNIECDHNNWYNVYMSDGLHNKIDNFSVNGSNQSGIYLHNSPGTILSNGFIYNNPTGIKLDSCGTTKINNTYLINNDIGIRSMNAMSGPNTIYNNYFDNINNIDFTDIHTISHVWTLKSIQTNILGNSLTGGNYWNDYHGPDQHLNGIGDIPYYVWGSSANIDYLPLVKITDTSKELRPINPALGMRLDRYTKRSLIKA